MLIFFKDSWVKELYEIVDAYKTDNSMCRFLVRHFGKIFKIFKMVYKSTMYDSKRAGGVISWPAHMEDLLRQSEINNPDPSKFVSFPIVGIDGLLERKKKQDEAEEILKRSVQKLEEKVTQLADKIVHYQETQLPHLDESVQNLQSSLLKVMH
jgi:hypothetical protein